MYKVGIIGSEASGKTTLARYLAKRYKGTYVREYARDYIKEKGTRTVSWDELCEIARYQIEEMERIEASGEPLVIFDTELIITKVWFDDAFGRVPEWLGEAIRKYPMDVYLLTYPDLVWKQDGTRYNGGDEKRMELFNRYEQEIEALNIPYYIIKHQ